MDKENTKTILLDTIMTNHKELCMELYIKYGLRDFDYDESNGDRYWATLYAPGYIIWKDPTASHDFDMRLTTKALELINGG